CARGSGFLSRCHVTNAHRMARDTRSSISSPKLEQDLAAALRLQGLLKRFLELVERVHLLHCGGERSISYEVAQPLVHPLDPGAGRAAYPIGEPEAVQAQTTEDEVEREDRENADSRTTRAPAAMPAGASS